MLFSVYCPTHDSNILMSRRNVVDFVNTNDGPVIAWKCNCGHTGRLTGDGSIPDPAPCQTPAA